MIQRVESLERDASATRMAVERRETRLAPSPRRASRAKSRAMRLLRRVHLVLGIALVPWVLLYGVTAFLFNHPTAASASERVRFTREELVASGFSRDSDAAEIATLVADALASGAGKRRGDSSEGVTAASVENLREFHWDGVERYERTTDAAVFTFSIDVESGRGLASSRSPRADRRGPFDREALRVELPASFDADGRKLAAAQLLANVFEAPDAAETRLRSGPVVQFVGDVAGAPHEFRYDVGAATLASRKLDAASGSSDLRTFLLRLHTAHDYPLAGAARTAWAVLVDVMAFAMVAFALSGLVMWWQLKSMRAWGAILVVTSLAAAVWVGCAMHAAMLG